MMAAPLQIHDSGLIDVFRTQIFRLAPAQLGVAEWLILSAKELCRRIN